MTIDEPVSHGSRSGLTEIPPLAAANIAPDRQAAPYMRADAVRYWEQPAP